ncbi:MAG: hypothetical protein Q7J22_00985, partial [Candidatus Wolfebacteria bacterium]|nr:hypothetical protein [Candidatus Wolfebacteria bacterium]
MSYTRPQNDKVGICAVNTLERLWREVPNVGNNFVANLGIPFKVRDKFKERGGVPKEKNTYLTEGKKTNGRKSPSGEKDEGDGSK